MTKAIITGSKGYIGSAFYKYLLAKKTEVVSIDKRHNGEDHIKMDLSPAIALDKLLQITPNPEIIYHFAGLFIKDYNKRTTKWLPFYINNVLATRHMATFADQIMCSIVFTSSLIVSSPFNQGDYYAISKKESEDEFLKFSNLQYWICRLSRVIGLYELPQNIDFPLERSIANRIEHLKNQCIIPYDIVYDFLRQAFNEDKTIKIYNAERQRSYIHLRDCIQGLGKIDKLPVGTYELCPYEPISIRRIGEIVAEELNILNIVCKLELIHYGEKDIIGPNNLPKIQIKKAFDITENLIRNVCHEYLILLGLK